MRTQYLPRALPAARCHAAFETLRATIAWEDGIPSRAKGFTRFAKALSYEENDLVRGLIDDALKLVGGEWVVEGCYLNYQLDGSNWTPNHSHKDTSQLVLSLGATRSFTLNKKTYTLENGDVVLFGAGIHGVPQEPAVKEGRIGIATFMRPRTRSNDISAEDLAAIMDALSL